MEVVTKMARITKASSISHAKTGYFVSSGAYPTMKQKYVKTKAEAIKLKKKWEKKGF